MYYQIVHRRTQETCARYYLPLHHFCIYQNWHSTGLVGEGRVPGPCVSRSVIIIPSSRHDTLSLMRSGIRREFSICVTLAVGVCLCTCLYVYLQYRTHIERVGDSQKALTSIYTSRALGERRVVEKKEVYPFTGAYVHTRERGLVHTHTTLYWPHGCVELESRRAVKAAPAPCLMQ